MGRGRLSGRATLVAPPTTSDAAPTPPSAPQPEASGVEEDRGESRIGILGGTFDPPHIGHLWLASLAAEELDLERVVFMPAGRPPHTRSQRVSAATDRLLMTRLAISGDDRFDLSALEMERTGPSFTVDTIEELQRMHGPATRLFLVMAADSLAQIDTWREPDRLLSMVEWAVGPRPGSRLDRAVIEQRFGAAASRIHLLDGPALDVSSSELRRRVATGRTISYLVPRSVEQHIHDRELYRARS
jgi:nicotinate-nucleotide adenylyltransferase